MENDANAKGPNRREFLKVSAAGLTSILLNSENFAYAAPVETVRVGLVGCGGRGKGAAADACRMEGVELVAMADLFPDRLSEARTQLQTALRDRYKVTDATAFTGWDGYKRVIDSQIDYVILATPVVFRPIHLAYAVEKGRHVFMEKPVAVDPVGCREVMELSDLAKQKGLALVAGTQRRHSAHYIEWVKRIQDGQMGEIVAGDIYWNTGEARFTPRKPEWSEMEYQLRNWIYYTHLSGDHIVEQHIHQPDVANWVMGAHPVKAYGTGGRQVRTDPKFGYVYDHFMIIYEYPNGAKVTSMCRQQDGTDGLVQESFVGTKGRGQADVPYAWIKGENPWTFSGKEINPYQQEHIDLVTSIKAGNPLNEGREVAESNLTAIMGREAAYTGKVVTWEQIMASNQNLTPAKWEFGDVVEQEVAMPGVTVLERGYA